MSIQHPVEIMLVSRSVEPGRVVYASATIPHSLEPPEFARALDVEVRAAVRELHDLGATDPPGQWAVSAYDLDREHVLTHSRPAVRRAVLELLETSF